MGPLGTGSGRAEAVFHYTVPQGKSHYKVQFCCVLDGFNSDGTANMRVFDETAGYHGEIAFDPANGAILRITMEAEMSPGELVSKAGIIVEYGPVEIAGKSYICPVKSVSVLQAHTTQNKGAFAMSNYKGNVKTYLNDVVFDQYRRFGSEMRIVPVDSGDIESAVRARHGRLTVKRSVANAHALERNKFASSAKNGVVK